MGKYTLDSLMSFINRVNYTENEYELLDEAKNDRYPLNSILLNFLFDKPFIKCYYDKDVTVNIPDYIVQADQIDGKTFGFTCSHGKKYKVTKRRMGFEQKKE